MTQLHYAYNDGGRSQYFRATQVSDCGVRAAAIASGRDYKEVYNLCKDIIGTSPRNGIYANDYQRVMQRLGAIWHPCMTIGSGCKTHLNADELPKGRIICRLSKHYVAVINHVINDIYDCSRGGSRCVYGYWEFPL